MTDTRIDDKTGTGRRRWRHRQEPPSNGTPPAAAPRPRRPPAARLRPLLAAALVAPSIVALGALTTPAAAHADFGDIVTRTFKYTGKPQSFVVPEGVAFVDITADGGGGYVGAAGKSFRTITKGSRFGDLAGSASPGGKGGAGGAGGKVTGTLGVKPGDQLHFSVGGAAGPQSCFDGLPDGNPLPGGRGGIGNHSHCAGSGGAATPTDPAAFTTSTSPPVLVTVDIF